MKQIPKDLSLFISSYIPKQNKEWFEEFFEECTFDELAMFVSDLYKDELEFFFSWIPKWAPPSWINFKNFGIPSTLPIYPRVALQLGIKELKIVRELALEIIGPTSTPEEAVFKIMSWVFKNFQWSVGWGIRVPSQIIQDRKGGCLHLAQITSALLRSLFLPCRLVECINLVPNSLIQAETKAWQKYPDIYQQWFGKNFWSHVFCEVLANDTWIPIDPTNGEYGINEALRHVRIPEFLKVLVRTFPDNGKIQTLNRKYIQNPLKINTNKDSKKAKVCIHRIEQSVSNNILTCRDAVANVSYELKWLQDYAILKRGSVLQRIKYSNRIKNETLEKNLKSAINNFTKFNSLNIITSSEAESISMEKIINEVRSGVFVIVILFSEAVEEKFASKILKKLGYDLGDWVVCPKMDTNIQVFLKGKKKSETPFGCDLNLPLVRRIIGAGKKNNSVETIVVDQDENKIAVKLKFGKGYISFIPMALVGGASPFYCDIISSNHRRILNVLVN